MIDDDALFLTTSLLINAVVLVADDDDGYGLCLIYLVALTRLIIDPFLLNYLTNQLTK